ncbi:MAG TPA: DoxX family protein [Methylomirabilota bacterium]|nr:DoxX family protein [Methylomirabilota bacterium]
MMKTETMTYSAPRPGLFGHLLAARTFLERAPFSIVQLVCRLAIAGVFLRAGMQKLAGWETTLALFSEEYKLPLLPPELAATMATATELGGSILISLGLATRLATLPFFGMILTIQLFVFPHAWPEHLTWSAILLVLLTRGAGAISLDRLLGHWIDRRS